MPPFISVVRRGIPGCLAGAALMSCAISQQQEVELGATTAAQVSAQLPLIKDAAGEAGRDTMRQRRRLPLQLLQRREVEHRTTPAPHHT